jgi:hypothetical protein
LTKLPIPKTSLPSESRVRVQWVYFQEMGYATVRRIALSAIVLSWLATTSKQVNCSLLRMLGAAAEGTAVEVGTGVALGVAFDPPGVLVELSQPAMSKAVASSARYQYREAANRVENCESM